MELRRHRAPLGDEPRRRRWTRAPPRRRCRRRCRRLRSPPTCHRQHRARTSQRSGRLSAANPPVGADVHQAVLQSAIDSEGGTPTRQLRAGARGGQTTGPMKESTCARPTRRLLAATRPPRRGRLHAPDRYRRKRCGDVGVGQLLRATRDRLRRRSASTNSSPCNCRWTRRGWRGGDRLLGGPYTADEQRRRPGAPGRLGSLALAGTTYTQYTCCTEDSGVPTQGSSCDYPAARLASCRRHPPASFRRRRRPRSRSAARRDAMTTAALSHNWVFRGAVDDE